MSNELSFQFDLKDVKAPEEVAKTVFDEVQKASNGYVKVKVEGYSKTSLTSSSRTVSLSALADALADQKMSTIQDKLGEIQAEKHIYEVYISARLMENYKYRMFFIKYETMSYPVEIILDNELAEQVLRQSRTLIINNDMESLEELLNKIKYSSYFTRYIQNIIYESIRRENKN